MNNLYIKLDNEEKEIKIIEGNLILTTILCYNLDTYIKVITAIAGKNNEELMDWINGYCIFTDINIEELQENGEIEIY